MSELTCPNCGGDMVGDGYKVQMHCETVDLRGHPEHTAPDGAHVYCAPKPKEWTYPISLALRRVNHQPKKRCYQVTLEVNEEIGARIMEYAAMVSGLPSHPWDESKLLDGGLHLTERGKK